jgi:chaperonin GroES
MAGTAKKATPRKKRPRKLPDGLRLTADRIVVSMPSDGERKTKAGLLIPATAGPTLKRCVWADVILVGPDARHVKTGDRVLFLPQVGLEVDIDGDDYLLLRERDVQAVTPSQSTDGDHAPGQYL